MRKDLTNKQKKFVSEYLIDLNATGAATRAGYSEKTAHVIGHENLKKPKVAAAIQARRQELGRETEINQRWVLERYKRLAEFDVRKLFDENENFVPISQLDDDQAFAIHSVEANVVKVESDDDKTEITFAKKVKASDKKAVLDSLARHLGMFTDKIKIGLEGELLYEILKALPPAYAGAVRKAIDKDLSES
ncbi:terminase small subunit [Desulfobacteraceae bacterium SEEP-SAG9]|nr:terminase small subunit [Desulfobacteraceae bacterium SEEP-SAG9]